jgi:hypothetical protein
MDGVQNEHGDVLVEYDNENVTDSMNVVECEKSGRGGA